MTHTGILITTLFLHLHLSRSLVDRWGVTDDLATSSLHASHLSAFLMAAYSVMPVHSGLLDGINLIFEMSVIFLSLQMVLSLASATVAWAILARISGLDPSSAMIAPRYLNLLTQI